MSCLSGLVMRAEADKLEKPWHSLVSQLTPPCLPVGTGLAAVDSAHCAMVSRGDRSSLPFLSWVWNIHSLLIELPLNISRKETVRSIKGQNQWTGISGSSSGRDNRHTGSAARNEWSETRSVGRGCDTCYTAPDSYASSHRATQTFPKPLFSLTLDTV